MAVQRGDMNCRLYRGAFSGEVVFAVETDRGECYEGVAPKHYAHPVEGLSKTPISGRIKVRVIKNAGRSARVRMPDGEAINVSATAVRVVR